MHGLNIIKRDNFNMRVTGAIAAVLLEYPELLIREVSELAKDYQGYVLSDCPAGMDDMEMEHPKLKTVFKAIRDELRP